MPTLVTMHAKKAMGEHATLEISPQLALDEARHGHAPIPGTNQEGLELFPDDLVKKRLLGLVACVFDTGVSAGTRTGMTGASVMLISESATARTSGHDSETHEHHRTSTMPVRGSCSSCARTIAQSPALPWLAFSQAIRPIVLLSSFDQRTPDGIQS